MDNLRELQVVYKDKTYKLSARVRQGPSGLIVFLHGWGGNKKSFAGAFSSDSLKDYGICTIDLLGFGKSEKPEDFSYDLLDQANIVAQAVNSLNAKKVYLVGHSMSGGIGLLTAPLIKNLVVFINAESNLAPNGSPSIGVSSLWLSGLIVTSYSRYLSLCRTKPTHTAQMVSVRKMSFRS